MATDLIWEIYITGQIFKNDMHNIWLWFFCKIHKSLGCDSIDFDAVAGIDIERKIVCALL